MKIRFSGIEPSRALRDWLARHEIAVMIDGPKKGDEDCDLFVVAPKTPADLKELPKIRSRHPAAWLSVVIRSASLTRPGVQKALAEHSVHDDIWPKESWEVLCLLSLPKWMRYRSLVAKVVSLEDTCRELKANCLELSDRSEKLIAQLERDVSLATSLHRALLPRAAPKVSGLEIASKYVPAAGPGGDYYDIFEFGDRRRFGFLLADSRTHGMAAALLAILIKIRLEEMKERFPDSKSFVGHLNAEIQSVERKELATLSLLYGILDRHTLTFQYTVAGNVGVYLWRLGELMPLASVVNPALGELDRHEFKESVLTLKPGDLLLLFTDGLEAPLKQGSASLSERITQVLRSAEPKLDTLDIQTRIMGIVGGFAEDTPLSDDVTLVQLRVPEGALYVASESK